MNILRRKRDQESIPKTVCVIMAVVYSEIFLFICFEILTDKNDMKRCKSCLYRSIFILGGEALKMEEWMQE